MLKLKDLGVTFKTGILSNNIRLDVYEKPGAPLELRFGINFGDVYNPDKSKKGLTHFVEHILCSGTKDYPNQTAITKYLEKFGAYRNASTSKNKVVFHYSYCNQEDSDKIFSIFSESLKSPVVSPENLQNEKGAIESERNQKYARPTEKVFQEFEKIVYFGTEYEHIVLGPKENVDTFQKEDVLNWLKSNLVGGNIGICLSGDINYEKASLLCEKFFSFIPKTEITRPQLPLPSIVSKKSDIHIGYVEVKEVNSLVILGFQTEGLDPYTYNLKNILMGILGGRQSSFLTRELRTKTGIAYAPTIFNHTYHDNGIFAFHVECKLDNIEKTLSIIIDILKNKLKQEISEELFEGEKQRHFVTLKRSYESSASLVNFDLPLILTENKIDLDQYGEDRLNVTYKNFLQFSENFFKHKNWILAYSGKEQLSLDKYLTELNNL